MNYKEKQFKLVKEIIMRNPSSKDAICCIEEMSELTKVLTKYLRNSPKFNKEKLAEEIGHVLLMCKVIAVRHGITKEEILAVQEDAVDRMLTSVE